MQAVRYQLALQVRLGSRRLPGKALLPLGDRHCVLTWVLTHLRQSRLVERFLLLCPQRDRAVLQPYAQHYGFQLFGGSEYDVWQRFNLALQYYPSLYCFRATGDNPLVLGSLLDYMIEQWQQKSCAPDYYWIRGLPHGFAAELFCSEALLKAAPLQNNYREHVTDLLYQNPERYTICYEELGQLLGPEFARASELRLTLDTIEDYLFLQRVFAVLQQRRTLEHSYINFGDLLLTLLKLPELLSRDLGSNRTLGRLNK